MQLKDYQLRTLDSFTHWWNELKDVQKRTAIVVKELKKVDAHVPLDVLNFPKTAWQKLSENGYVSESAGPYVDRTAAAGYPISHVCFKVPTGGGKTLLGAAALERLNKSTGLVLWMVPSNAIYSQTKEALWNREHPYRKMIEKASGGKTKMLEKDDLFTKSDINHYLCFMLISLQSANRKNNKNFLRMFRDSGRYSSFFPDIDDYVGNTSLLKQCPDLDQSSDSRIVKQSLSNVFKMLKPVIVLDEAHKAYGKRERSNEEFLRSINYLNPSLVLELSATPNRLKSNLLVDVSGVDLKNEEMIKLPVQITSFVQTNWKYTLAKAHEQLEKLDTESVALQHSEGRYVRPIVVVRVERTGKDQRDGEHIHAEDVREYLIQSLGTPASAIAIQSATRKELVGVDLLSPFSQIQWIVTKSALMEGWDCPFAYILVMLDNTKAQQAITQLVGRVMRQPHARLTGSKLLDQCYVFCHDIAVDTAVNHVKNGLEQEGMTGLENDVFGQGAFKLSSALVKRRTEFQQEEIFFPRVLHSDAEKEWIELEYERHIVPNIAWESIGLPDVEKGIAQGPQRVTATVDLEESNETVSKPQNLLVDTSIQLAWYTRRLSDVVPNPFRAAALVQDLIERLYRLGLDDNVIYTQRSILISQLREHVIEVSDKLAEQVFQSKLARGEIRFDLEISDYNHRFTKNPPEVLVSDSDTQLQHYGNSVRSSLFEPIFSKDFNELERRFAFYLDEQEAIRWWHRVAVGQRGEYYLRGWRRNRIWPDFVAMMGEIEGQPRILVFETKGKHLEGNDDTSYKERVFSTLEESFNCGSMTVREGPIRGIFRLVFDQEGFPDVQSEIEKLNYAE